MFKKFKSLDKNDMEKLPNQPGVYSLSGAKDILYVGKAANIKERVKSHFKQPSYKDNLFINKVKRIGFIETNSEIGAFLLEADLIKKLQPKYNVMWRDDKNYFYVGVTKDRYPHVFLTHQLKNKKNKIRADYIGPFIDGGAIKTTLRALRRIFPYSTLKKHPQKPCPYCHLGLCPGPNPNLKEYKKDLNKLKNILMGKKNNVLTKLQKEMKQAAISENFETAARIRNQISALEKTMDNAKVIWTYPVDKKDWPRTEKELRKIVKKRKKIKKIEAYDISNIQGKEATGAMVTFIEGKPDKSLYRKFKIRTGDKPNDVAMIKEILERRLKHSEWDYPDLMLIDGGKAQLNAAQQALIQHKSPKSKKIKVLALAKRKNELFVGTKKNSLLLKDVPREVFDLILQLRDEAHRFARKYHFKLRKRKLFS